MIYKVCVFSSNLSINFILNLESAGPSTDTRCLRKVSSSLLIYFLYLYNDCRFRYGTGAFVCLLHSRVSDFPCTTFMLSHIETHCLKSSLLIWLGIEPNITNGSRRRSTNGVHITICFNMVPRVGIEPTTPDSSDRCSTN